MALVVGVRFKEKGKAYYFGCGDLRLTVGDNVVVETVKGIDVYKRQVEPSSADGTWLVTA